MRAEEREAAARVQENKAKNERQVAMENQHRENASRHLKKANEAQAKANEFRERRVALLKQISGRITNEERARRFNARHGLDG